MAKAEQTEVEPELGFTKDEMSELESVAKEPESEPEEKSEPEPAAESVAEESTDATPDDEAKPTAPSKPPAGYVPHEALHESRQQQQELRDKVVRMETLWDDMQSRLSARQQAEQSAAKAQEVPDYEKDPIGHLTYRLQHAEQRLQANDQQSNQRQQVEQQNAQANQMLEQYASSVREYTEKSAPDFKEAYTYLTDIADKELQQRGFTNPQERANMLQFEEGRIVGNAFSSDKSPAEVIYELAKFRGYKTVEGKSPPPKIETLKRGQRASKSLSGSGGSVDGMPTLEALADLEGDEFDKAFEKLANAGKLG